MESRPKKNIGKYLESNAHFLIPAYQRGYKWGMATGGMSDAQALMADLIEAFKQTPRREYFIQGVTGYEKDGVFHLIDGQQRTTTLFLIVAILVDEKRREALLFSGGELKLRYFGRRGKTARFLERFCREGVEECADDTQDIHFLRKAIREIRAMLPADEGARADFLEYLLESVYLFQVEVSPAEAPNVFSMMNGNKADMKIGELIKAEYLSGLSRMEVAPREYQTSSVGDTLSILTSQIQEETATEWKINAARSRYAREWDKWTYWWQRPETRAFFRVDKDDVTGWLFPVYCRRERIAYSTKIDERRDVFKAYKADAMSPDSLKESFEKLRRIEKRLEDLYDSTTTYNLLGFVLRILEDDGQRLEALDYFIEQRDEPTLWLYTIYRMAWLTHDAAIARIKHEEKEEQAKDSGDKIDGFVACFGGDIYNEKDAKEAAMRYLFFCNVEAAEERGAKFEFFYEEDGQLKSYWKYKSLEHIWPKSRVSDEEKKGMVTRRALDEREVSEHMLGNMAFLHKTDNSKFNALTPNEKRLKYFDLNEKIYSRGMLHTMAAFGGKEWDVDESLIPAIIQRRHEEELSKLKALYGQKD